MLVNYSDSDSEDEPQLSKVNLEATKRTVANVKESPVEVATCGKFPSGELPPLPTSFQSLYATNTRKSVVDDPNLYGGRTRQVPHVEGNWPTHIYLEWFPNALELKTLTDVFTQAQNEIAYVSESASYNTNREIYSLLRSDLEAPLPLHISLSAPLVLRTHQKTPFQDTYEQELASSSVNEFTTSLVGLDWAPNFDRTRFFLILRLSRPENDELNKLLTLSNRCANKFGLDALYETQTTKKSPQIQAFGEVLDYSSTFHISIAWSLCEPSRQEKELLSNISLREMKDIKIKFNYVKLKIGNSIQHLRLLRS